MKKVFSILSGVCLLTVAVAEPPELGWVSDPHDSSRLVVVKQKTGKAIGEIEILQQSGLDERRTVPSSDREYSAFVDEYLSTPSDTLNYSSTFWDVVKRSVIDLKFSVVTEEKTEAWLRNMEFFMGCVSVDTHRFFVSKIISKFFGAWKNEITELQNALSKSALTSEQLHIELLRTRLNALIECVNSKKQHIGWTF